MVIGVRELVAIAMALGVAAMILRFLMGWRRSSSRFPVGPALLLFVLWLYFSRQHVRQDHSPQSWANQQPVAVTQNAAMAKQVAKQHAEIARHLAESQAQAFQSAAQGATKKNGPNINANFELNQQQWTDVPQARTPRRAQAWATAQSSSARDAVSWANSELTPPTAPHPPAPVTPIMRQQAVIVDEKGEPATWVLLAPLAFGAVALVGFVAMRRVRHAAAGNGLGWLAAGVAVLAMVGFLYLGSIRTRVVIPGREIGDESTVSMQQIGSQFVGDSEAQNRESIDIIWERLSAPQIKLDWDEPKGDVEEKAPNSVELSPKQITTAQAKLNDAAQVLTLAAERMNESNSQGWLVVMAEALLKATAKSTTAQAEETGEAPASQQVADADAPTAPLKAPQSLQLAERPHVGVRFPRGRRKPDWVVHHPGIVGEVRKYVVESGPYKTLDECHRELEEKMRSIVQGRVIELVKSSTGDRASVPSLQAMGVGTDYILRELCTEEYVETNEYDFGDMLTAHALMEFNAAQDAALLNRWTAYARRAGVERTAIGAGLVVGCLALAFGLLKVDTWTRGYYSKRLFLGVPAAIIAVVVVLSFAGF